MPVKEREVFVPDEEARELDRLFRMRDVRRYIRDKELGTLYYTEKWEGKPLHRPAPVSGRRGRRPLHRAYAVAAAVCWFLVLGAVGSLEMNRVELLPGVLAMCGFCIAAVLFGFLACTRTGSPSKPGEAGSRR